MSHIFPISKSNGYYDICIDLETGEIIIHPDGHILKRYLLQIQVLRDYYGEDLGSITAQAYIDELTKEIYREYFGGYNPRKVSQWRADIRAKDPISYENSSLRIFT